VDLFTNLSTGILMAAINTSISYQSQFASPNTSLKDMRTKSGAQSQMDNAKSMDPKPTSPKFRVQSVSSLGDVGNNVNLKA
jgi:hypothetical protein